MDFKKRKETYAMISNINNQNKCNDFFYNHYLGLDWSEKTMAIARMNPQSIKPKVFEKATDLSYLKKYLGKLEGKKILTIEETTSTHWLYVELKDYVDKVLICDPYRNGLLKEGAKTDKIDAKKLCLLLRSGLLKEVYHSTDKAYEIRKLVSAYNDLTKAGTRIQNQKSAFYRGIGLKYKKEELDSKDDVLTFINDNFKKSIEIYEEDKRKFIDKFEEISKENKTIQQLMTVSGIGTIWAITIYAIVVDATRFPDKYHYWSYCGLAYNNKESGGRNYGRKKPRYCRELKKVYTSAAYSAINGNNDINQYFQDLLYKGVNLKKAYNMIVRHIAKSTYAILKNKENYKPFLWRERK